jgi:hypothetical protein
MTLQACEYLGGQKPTYSDYALFGSLQWPRCAGGTPLLVEGSAVHAWFNRMLDLYNGFGRKSPTIADLGAP